MTKKSNKKSYLLRLNPGVRPGLSVLAKELGFTVTVPGASFGMGSPADMLASLIDAYQDDDRLVLAFRELGVTGLAAKTAVSSP